MDGYACTQARNWQNESIQLLTFVRFWNSQSTCTAWSSCDFSLQRHEQSKKGSCSDKNSTGLLICLLVIINYYQGKYQLIKNVLILWRCSSQLENIFIPLVFQFNSHLNNNWLNVSLNSTSSLDFKVLNYLQKPSTKQSFIFHPTIILLFIPV